MKLVDFVYESITNPSKVLMYKGFKESISLTPLPKHSPVTLAEFVVYVMRKGKWKMLDSTMGRHVALVTIGELQCLVITPHDDFNLKVVVGVEL